MVYEAERHEALDGSDWNEATAREFIERVAAEANITFSPRELWPTHGLVADSSLQICQLLALSGRPPDGL